VKEAGQVVLIPFPYADLREGKFRPALLLCKLPGKYDDWLTCMITSQLRQYTPEFDHIIQEGDPDFEDSGLKMDSVIRVGRLAVIQGDLLPGAIGQISSERLQQIKDRLVEWITGP
jgi:mRNA interferase MazF